jgi:hypothetical protein
MVLSLSYVGVYMPPILHLTFGCRWQFSLKKHTQAIDVFKASNIKTH